MFSLRGSDVRRPRGRGGFGRPRFEVPSTFDGLSRWYAQPLSSCKSLCREPCLSNVLLSRRELFVDLLLPRPSMLSPADTGVCVDLPSRLSLCLRAVTWLSCFRGILTRVVWRRTRACCLQAPFTTLLFVAQSFRSRGFECGRWRCWRDVGSVDT